METNAVTVRVTVNKGCPWPARVGCAGQLVERPTGPAGDVYPWPGLGSREVVVRLDQDPLGHYQPGGFQGLTDGWTHVDDAANLTVTSANPGELERWEHKPLTIPPPPA